MHTFDPVRHIDNSQQVLVDGAWPNFHDAEVHDLHIWRGDVRPADEVWIGPQLTMTFELCAEQFPFLVVLRFHDCEGMTLGNFNHQNAIYDLTFEYQERGNTKQGRPLTPYIWVNFEQAFGMGLSLKCYRIEVVTRREIKA